MKKEELKKKSKGEMQRILKENRKKVTQLRFDLAAGKVKNVKEIRKIKKEIARILTFLKEQ